MTVEKRIKENSVPGEKKPGIEKNSISAAGKQLNCIAIGVEKLFYKGIWGNKDKTRSAGVNFDNNAQLNIKYREANTVSLLKLFFSSRVSTNI